MSAKFRAPFLTAIALAATFCAAPLAAQPASLSAPVTVRNISHRELQAGMPVSDSNGVLIGTIRKVAGNTIVIAGDGVVYRVPITQLYAVNDGGADHIASRVPKSSFTARADAGTEPESELGG